MLIVLSIESESIFYINKEGVFFCCCCGWWLVGFRFLAVINVLSFLALDLTGKLL